MRRNDINTDAYTGYVEYPDNWCFAFNPNYINVCFDSAQNGEIEIFFRCDEKEISIKASLYNNRAEVYISRLLSIFFDKPQQQRSKTIVVEIKKDDSSLSTFSLNVVWGVLNIKGGSNRYFSVKETSSECVFKRKVVWFTKFPFSVSMIITESDGNLLYKKNSEAYKDDFLSLPRIIEVYPNEDGTDIIEGRAVLENPVVVYYEETKKVCAYDSSDKAKKKYSQWDSKRGDGTEFYVKGGKLRHDIVFLNRHTREICCMINNDIQLQTLSMFSAETTGMIDLFPLHVFTDIDYNMSYKIELGETAKLYQMLNYNTNSIDGKTVSSIVDIVADSRQNGIYLRWIDTYGFIQYYLFQEGNTESKSKYVGNEIEKEHEINGIKDGGYSYFTEVTETETTKCCAVNLPKDILEYVMTVRKALIVEKYIGDIDKKTNQWQPVVVSEGTVTRGSNKTLYNVEISIERNFNSQAL